MMMVTVTDDAATAVAKKRKRVEKDFIKNGNQHKRIRRLEANPGDDASSVPLLMDIDDAEPSTLKGIKWKQVDCYETDDDKQSMEEPNHSNIPAKRQKMQQEVLSIGHITTRYSAFYKFEQLKKKTRIDFKSVEKLLRRFTD